jgi:hypothetical protein
MLDNSISKSFIQSLEGQGIRVSRDWPLVPNDIESGDFLVNAWDPNSNIGNGNEADNSLDGYVGRYCTAAYDIHSSPNLMDSSKYISVSSDY